MNKQTSTNDIYVADFTRYKAAHPQETIPCNGVSIGEDPNTLIPSFWLENPHHCAIDVVNIEQNTSLFKHEDGTPQTQCECICYAIREESPAWMLFIELKYCQSKNRYDNVLTGMHQLKETCKYVLEDKAYFEDSKYKRIFVVSTPEVEPLDPFDATYFDQEDMLLFKKECKAILYLANHLVVHTPVHVKLPA